MACEPSGDGFCLDYKPGSIAGFLNTGHSEKQQSDGDSRLEKLFSAPKLKKKQIKAIDSARKLHKVSKISKNKESQKLKLKELKHLAKESVRSSSTQSRNTANAEELSVSSSQNASDVAMETRMITTADEKDSKDQHPDRKLMRLKAKQMKEVNREKLKRTVFVGNLPVSITKKELKTIMKDFGAVESIRIRSAAPANPKMPKKGVVARKEFHPNVSNINAYVVFKEVTAAKKATKLNGESLDDKHICVDYLGSKKRHDHKRSLFVGNLPFDASEEDVREHFSECGEIVNIRLIRDKFSRVGKGFGYVLFKESDAVELALKFEGQKFKGRKLRLERSAETEKGNKEKQKGKASSLKRSGEAKSTSTDADHDTSGEPKRKKKKKNIDAQEKSSVGTGKKSLTAAKRKEKVKKKLRHRLERKKKQRIADILAVKSAKGTKKSSPDKVKPDGVVKRQKRPKDLSVKTKKRPLEGFHKKPRAGVTKHSKPSKDNRQKTKKLGKKMRQ